MKKMYNLKKSMMKKNGVNKIIIFPLLFLLTFASVFAQPEDLILTTALEKALENNYGIVISRSDAEIATVNNSWGTAGRYPSIGFDASSSNNYTINSGDNYLNNRITAGVGLRWTIFNGFRINLTKGKLEQLEILAKGRSAVIIENTIQNVILAYYQVLVNQERLSVLEKVMALSGDRYEYEKIRHELGGAVTYEVLQAQNLFLEDKANVMNQEVICRNAVRNLNFLLGEEATATWSFPEKFMASLEEYDLDDLLDKMLANNNTLQNQYINLLLQQNEIELAKSALYPSLTLSTGIDESFSRMQVEGADPSTSSALVPYGNVSLSFDIYSGGNRKSAIEVAKINEEISRVETDEMVHSLTNQLMNLYDYYEVRKALLEVAEESLEAAELNLQIAEEKYKTGAINSFNYRDIQLIFLNSAFRRLQAIYDLIDSHTNLTRLTGGFLDETE